MIHMVDRVDLVNTVGCGVVVDFVGLGDLLGELVGLVDLWGMVDLFDFVDGLVYFPYLVDMVDLVALAGRFV